jgi:integrase-like protein
VLAEQAADGEALLRIPPPEDCAELVRKDLLAAGCQREELYADDGERQHFTFHGLRHTCLTHWVVAGRPLQWLLVAAGHTSYEVTQGYVDAASMLRGTFGPPHPPLPEELVREVAANTMRNTVSNAPKLPKLLATPTGIEPVLPT